LLERLGRRRYAALPGGVGSRGMAETIDLDAVDYAALFETIQGLAAELEAIPMPRFVGRRGTA